MHMHIGGSIGVPPLACIICQWCTGDKSGPTLSQQQWVTLDIWWFLPWTRSWHLETVVGATPNLLGSVCAKTSQHFFDIGVSGMTGLQQEACELVRPIRLLTA